MKIKPPDALFICSESKASATMFYLCESEATATNVFCAKAKRQQQMFSVAKAKRQLQLRQGEIDKMSQEVEASFFVVKSGLMKILRNLVD
ncbi:hypothetical protein [Lysinibacillus xylanilyticus]|uniref:hypothetical protein n=1 Tax=Lysinibacillus xylanilyticus TaxID=582475 RepID=UPI003D066897